MTSSTAAALPQARLASVYDGGSVTLRFLRALGWGPALLNLGYFPLRGPLNALNLLPGRFRLAAAQLRLVRRAAGLLAPTRGERVLDVACGRGQSSYFLAQRHPGVEVTGIDLLDDNVRVASTLFAHVRGLSYEQGDAQALRFPDAGFDKALCLEAAFHFPDKARFVAEAARVLRPGGRLVVVDFMWRARDRAAVLADPRTRIVQATWGWDDFYSLDEYLDAAKAAGLAVERQLDWSGAVTRPLDGQFDAVTRLGGTAWGRRLMAASNDMLGGFSRGDWQELRRAAEAHRFVNRHALYGALVLRKSP